MAEPSRAWISPSDVVVYVNRRGAYRFSYPSGWSLTERGTAAAVTSPRGTGVVTVGTIESGTIEQAADLFVARMASVYEDVEILRRETSGSGTLPMVGTATDAAGDQRRFAATVVGGREGEFVVGAFTPVGDPSLEAEAREILRSFRLLSDDGRAGSDS